MKKSKKISKKKNEEELSAILCEECDEPITLKRIKALPNTTLCINCAELKEKEGDFIKSHMEIITEVEKGEFDSLDTQIIKGD